MSRADLSTFPVPIVPTYSSPQPELVCHTPHSQSTSRSPTLCRFHLQKPPQTRSHLLSPLTSLTSGPVSCLSCSHWLCGLRLPAFPPSHLIFCTATLSVLPEHQALAWNLLAVSSQDESLTLGLTSRPCLVVFCLTCPSRLISLLLHTPSVRRSHLDSQHLFPFLISVLTFLPFPLSLLLSKSIPTKMLTVMWTHHTPWLLLLPLLHPLSNATSLMVLHRCHYTHLYTFTELLQGPANQWLGRFPPPGSDLWCGSLLGGKHFTRETTCSSPRPVTSTKLRGQRKLADSPIPSWCHYEPHEQHYPAGSFIYSLIRSLNIFWHSVSWLALY